MSRAGENRLERLRAEAERVRRARAFGRSLTLYRLFDFLAAQAEADHAPTELDIAVQVFGKAADFDVSSDAVVRVNIHRMRQKLADHYRRSPHENADRLAVPKGEYRLVLETFDAVPEPAGAPTDRPFPRRALLVGAAGLAAGGAATWAFMRSQSGGSPMAGVRRRAPWRGLDESRPVIIVLNDFYIFGDSEGGLSVSRLIRRFDVNSRADLEAYRAAEPDSAESFVDLDMRYVPVGAALALRNVTLVVGEGGARPRLMLASDLTPETLRQAHIVYVGYLSGLGLLREPLARRSRLRPGESFDELVDSRTNRIHRSQSAGRGPSSGPQTDYGYAASFAGPGGGRILVISGTRDSGLMHMSDVLTSASGLDELSRLIDVAGDFEALYRVEGIGHVDLNGRPVLADSLAAPDRAAP